MSLHKTNYIAFSPKGEFIILRESCFSKNIFFLKGYKTFFYTLSDDHRILSEIAVDGTVFNLELEEN